ncbi:hypothetical protein [Filimonas effusa]|nr:hypothetical protein [Filimonas effusa]
MDGEKQNIIVRSYNYNTNNESVDIYSPIGVKLGQAGKNKSAYPAGRKISLEDNFSAFVPDFSVPVGEPGVDTVYNLIQIYQKDKLIRSFLPYNQKKNLGFCTIGGALSVPNTADDRGNVYVSTPLEHFLYKISKDTAIKLGQFIFPADRSVSDDIIYSEDKNAVAKAFKKTSGIKTILDVSNVFFHKNLLFFKINTRQFTSFQGSEGVYLYNFVYDTSSGKAFSLERATIDSLSAYLPVLGNNSHVKGLVNYKGYIYSTLSSFQLFSAYDKLKSGNIKFPAVIEKYFATQNRKSNPVIVRMRIKG